MKSIFGNSVNFIFIYKFTYSFQTNKFSIPHMMFELQQAQRHINKNINNIETAENYYSFEYFNKSTFGISVNS